MLKNIIKALNSANKFGLVAIIFVAFSAIAFKAPTKVPNNMLTEYGREADGDWVPVGSAQPGEEPGQYTCEESDLPCRALFASQPENSEAPEPGNIIQDDGDYTIH